MNLLFKRLWIQISADHKRLGALGVLLAIGLLLWARVLVVSKPPRTAVADPNEQTEAVADATSKRASAGRESSQARPSMTIELSSRPNRNPFVISRTYFPKSQKDKRSEKEAKSRSKPSDNAPGKQARLRARLQSAVNALRLEAVLSGTLAVISGETYRQGETVPVGDSQEFQLTLAKVQKRSVMLTHGEHQFTLSMESPRSK